MLGGATVQTEAPPNTASFAQVALAAVSSSMANPARQEEQARKYRRDSLRISPPKRRPLVQPASTSARFTGSQQTARPHTIVNQALRTILSIDRARPVSS